MHDELPVKLTRDCDAIQVPSGTIITLPAGTEVKITQVLGGNFTVITLEGFMAQIMGKDADALGRDVPPEAKTPDVSGKPLEELVWGQLKTCYDPEIPVNIVDLGLVYDMKIQPLEQGGNRVDVKMTLTAPGCGMGQALTMQAQSKILGIPGVKEADVELVWDPPWDRNKLSDAAKLQLGMM